MRPTQIELASFINDTFGFSAAMYDIIPTSEDLVVLRKHGRFFREFSPLSTSYPKMAPNSCYENSAKFTWSNCPQFTYVQGFLYIPVIRALVGHAWCVDENNKILDPTLEPRENEIYFGIRLPLAALANLQLRNETYDWYEDLSDIFLGAEIS